MHESLAALIPAGARVFLRLHVEDFLHENFEDVSDVDISKRASFPEEQAVLIGELFSPLVRDLPFTRLLLADVQFISDEDNDDVRLCVLLHFLHPLLDAQKRLLLRNVVHYEGSHRPAIMSTGKI